MPSVYAVARTFRAELLAGDDAAKRQVLDAYLAAWKVLEPQLVQVTRLIADARRSGEDVSPAWLYRQSRYRDLLQQVGAEVSRLASALGPLITNRQAALVRLAEDHARELLRAGKTPQPGVIAGFNRINPEAVLQIIGQLRDGSPLVDLLRLMAPEAVIDVRAAFTRGIILGESIPQITRRVRDAIGDGNPLYPWRGKSQRRAATIVRNETLRAFRESSRISYQENSDVVRGWVWLSARDKRVDAFCWAMDGSFHPVSARMASHVNCRCTMVPWVKGEANPLAATGPELFAELPPERQRRAFGAHETYKAYAGGAITLKDIPTFRRSAQWGRTGYERTLTDILGEEEALAWRRAA
jgi:SPP1 gp7 family putative phage head morphogenesis protein